MAACEEVVSSIRTSRRRSTALIPRARRTPNHLLEVPQRPANSHLNWEFFGVGERTRTADLHVAKKDRRNPVNRTYANSPLLTCGSTRHHAAVQMRPFASSAEGQFVRVEAPDRSSSKMLLRAVDLVWLTQPMGPLSPRREGSFCASELGRAQERSGDSSVGAGRRPLPSRPRGELLGAPGR